MMLCNKFSNKRNKSFTDIVLTNCPMTWLLFLNKWFFNIYFNTPTENKSWFSSIIINYMSFPLSFRSRELKTFTYFYGEDQGSKVAMPHIFQIQKRKGFYFLNIQEQRTIKGERKWIISGRLFKITLENNNFYLLRYICIHSARIELYYT